MSKRKRYSHEDNQQQQHEEDEENDEELKAVFVDTSLDTHLVVLVSPLLSFSLLKERIVAEHSKCFPDFGEIKIDALKVKREQNYYHLSESMLLRIAFHGVESWFVFADVAGTPFNRPPKAQSIPVKKLQPNLTSQKHVPNLEMPNNPSKNFESKAAERGLNNSSPEADIRYRSRKKKIYNREATVLEALASSRPAENILKFEGNNALEASLLETSGLKSGFEGGASESKRLVSKKGDLQKNEVTAAIVLPSKVVEISIAGHVGDASSVSTGAAAGTGTAKRTGELLRQSEGTGKSSGNTLNEESVVHNAEASGSRTKRTKKKKKRGGYGVDNSHAAELGQEPEIMRNDVSAFGDEKITLERELNRINTEEEGTPLNLTCDSELLLSQPEVLYLVERGVNEEDVAPLKSSELKISESGNTSKKRKTSKAKSSSTEKQDLSSIRENNDLESANTWQKGTSKNAGGIFSELGGVEYTGAACGSQAKKTKKTNKKDFDRVNKSHAAQLGQVPDMMQNGVTALDSDTQIICERESDNKRTAEEEIKKSGVTAKKRKTHKTKTSVTAKQDLSSPRNNNDQELADSRLVVTEFSQSGDISKPEQSADTMSKSRARSPSEQKTHFEDSSGFSLKEQFNERMKDMAAPETVTDDFLRENDTNDTAGQSQVYHEELNSIPAHLVSANVVEGTKVDKPKASKKKTKKSKENEKTSQVVVPQSSNNNLEAADTEEIGADLLQPARSSKTEGNSELGSVNPKKRSKSRQTTPAIDVPEIPVTEQVDDSLLTNSSVSGYKIQRKLGDIEHEHLNESSVQTVSAHEADMQNPEKQPASKSKRKKLDQPSFVDTSSNLRTSKDCDSDNTSLVGHQLQSDVHEAEQMTVTGVESFQPSQDNNPEVNEEIAIHKPKKRPQKKRSASEKNLSDLPMKQQLDILKQKTADDNTPYSNVNNAEKQEEVSLHEKCCDDSTEVRKLDNPPASKSKGKKLDLSSSVDISSNAHNLITEKNSQESERNVLVGSELQNDIHESELFSQIGTKPVQLHQVNQHEDRLDDQSVKVKQMVQKKPTSSTNFLSEVEQPDVLLTNSSNNAAKHRKGMSVPEEHYKDPDEILSQEVSSGLPKVTMPEKPTASKQEVKNAEFKGENLTASNKKSGSGNNSMDGSKLQKLITEKEHDFKPHSSTNRSTSTKDMDTEVPVGSRSSGTSSLISGSSAKRTHLGKNTKEVKMKNNQEHFFKTPSNKIVGVPVNSLPQKKHLPATSGGLFGDLSSDSSDDEVERNGSSCSTRTPEDLSSSDYSEGESKGDVVTSQHDSRGGGSARDKTNLNLSALKDMNLESVLRSSRRYKKAKLVASQSQMEDGESEPPEFVPDSQANS